MYLSFCVGPGITPDVASATRGVLRPDFRPDVRPSVRPTAERDAEWEAAWCDQIPRGPNLTLHPDHGPDRGSDGRAEDVSTWNEGRSGGE